MDSYLIWSLVFFVVGLLFAAIEVVVPSAGLLGIVALLCLGGSVLSAYQVSGLTAAVMAGIEVVCVPAVVAVAFKILPRTRFGKGLVLSPPATAGADPARMPAAGASNAGPYDALRGAVGVVATELRPSGTAEFDGRRVSVVSNGETIGVGARVRVVLVEGNRVVVESAEA